MSRRILSDDLIILRSGTWEIVARGPPRDGTGSNRIPFRQPYPCNDDSQQLRRNLLTGRLSHTDMHGKVLAMDQSSPCTACTAGKLKAWRRRTSWHRLSWHSRQLEVYPWNFFWPAAGRGIGSDPFLYFPDFLEDGRIIRTKKEPMASDRLFDMAKKFNGFDSLNCSRPYNRFATSCHRTIAGQQNPSIVAIHLCENLSVVLTGSTIENEFIIHLPSYRRSSSTFSRR
ncbi:hypothetical protein GGR54DRAFT_40704 [Hypoxylon sp. NC1633]|nr:hypothetical protein GGR54DRAFT_40704 [Hypoxylon sp. NC1633]